MKFVLAILKVTIVVILLRSLTVKRLKYLSETALITSFTSLAFYKSNVSSYKATTVLEVHVYDLNLPPLVTTFNSLSHVIVILVSAYVSLFKDRFLINENNAL